MYYVSVVVMVKNISNYYAHHSSNDKMYYDNISFVMYNFIEKNKKTI